MKILKIFFLLVVGLLLMSLVNVDAALFQSWPSGTGIGIGDESLKLTGPGENLLYGLIDQTTAQGSYILFQKGLNNDRFRVDVNGNLTTYGTGNITAAGNVSGAQLCLQGVCKSAWSQVSGDDGDWTISGVNMYSAASGNVGIGTTSPNQKLSVTDTFAVTNTAGVQKFLIGNQDSAGVNNPAIISGANGALYFGGGNSWSGNGGTMDYSMTILDNGYVGIGTTAPNRQLHVKTASGNAEIDIQSGSSNHWGIYQDDNTDQLRFWNTQDRVRVTNGGSVGIGVNYSPNTTYLLDVDGKANADELCIAGTCQTSWPSGASGTAGGDLSETYPNPQIASGVIVDADINAIAGIAGTKILSNFGSQNIVTTGNMTLGNDGKFGFSSDLSAAARSLKLRSSYSGDQADAGTIAYRPSWDSQTLAIVGAGTTGTNREVRIWDLLGIGKNPNAALDVSGDAYISGNVGIGNTDTAGSLLKVTGELKANWIHSTNSGDNTIAGNLAVGKTNVTPGYALDVNGNAYFSGNITLSGKVNNADAIDGFGDTSQQIYSTAPCIGQGGTCPTASNLTTDSLCTLEDAGNWTCVDTNGGLSPNPNCSTATSQTSCWAVHNICEWQCLSGACGQASQCNYTNVGRLVK